MFSIKVVQILKNREEKKEEYSDKYKRPSGYESTSES